MQLLRLAAASVALLALSGTASAQQVESTSWTTDEATTHGSPETWPNPTDTLTSSFSPGQKIWFAVNNGERDGHTKFWALRITVSPANAVGYFEKDIQDPRNDVEGFLSAFNDSDPIDPVNQVVFLGGFVSLGLGVDESSYSLTPCTEWERRRYRVTQPMDNVTITMKSVSMCSLAANEAIALRLDDTSIGAPGAMSSTAPTREILVFPRETPVDAAAEHSFSTPGWTWEYVTFGPDGSPYPLGGVRFFTLGPGLTTADRFDARVVMLGASSTQYDVYLVDSTGDIEHLVVEPRAATPVPVMSAWGSAVLGAAVLFIGTVLGKRLAPSVAHGSGRSCRP